MATQKTNTPIRSIEDFIKRTNFGSMRKQKRIIIKAQTGGKLTPKQQEELEGALNFFDAFQDLSVDVYGLSEKKVFGKKISE